MIAILTRILAAVSATSSTNRWSSLRHCARSCLCSATLLDAATKVLGSVLVLAQFSTTSDNGPPACHSAKLSSGLINIWFYQGENYSVVFK